VISLARTQIHKFTKDHCGTVPIGWCLLCFFVCGFIGGMGHTNAQMHKFANNFSRLINGTQILGFSC